MKGFDVLKIKSAVKSRNNFDLSFDHLTTLDFAEIMPLAAIETVPSDKFNIRGDYFARMAPLVKPTYGKFQFKTVSAFVPYYQLADDAEAWLAGKTTWLGTTPHHRFITMGNLDNFIRNYCITQTGATTDNAQYSWTDDQGQTQLALFTPNGKMYIKILNALGYACPQGVNLQANSNWLINVNSIKLSAYPLLAYFKLYNDYMSQSQRYNSSALSLLLHNIKHGIADISNWDSTSGSIKGAGLMTLFSFILLQYENDYFTSAWQQPNNPINSIESVGATTYGGVVAYTDVQNTYFSRNVSSNSITIPQRALDLLKDYDNWVRRNNYSGSREVQQIYSRMGIKVEDYKSNYCHVISTESMPIQVGDVTSTNESNDVILGEYAGKAIMNGSNGFSYDCTDYGIILVLGYFTVRPMMAYGFDRSVLRRSALDYYNPEFDGLGAEAISYAEVYENPRATIDADTSMSTSVFGYTERYNSYRYGRDKITGEFRNFINSNPMNTWHTGRNLNAIRKDGSMVAQSSAMNSVERVNSQYNRIFSITDDKENKFYLTCHFTVKAVRPMLNLNQVVNLGEGDTNIPRNGNTIS